MEITYLTNFTWLSILLLLGVILSIIAVKLTLPQILLLILAGVGLGYTSIIQFSPAFLTTLGLFALVMIIFDSLSAFNIKELNKFSPMAAKLAFYFFLVNIIFLTFFSQILFGDGLLSVNTTLLSILFAALMSGTDPSSVLTLLKGAKSELTRLLEFESVINTPITVIFPLVILFWFQGKLIAQDIAIFFARGVTAGIGTGLVIGIVSFKLMKKRYSETLSPLLIIAIALISYTLAEAIGGNGVLSVSALAILYGTMEIKKKESMEKFINIFSSFLTIVLFILLGVFIKIPQDLAFILKSLLLFGLFILFRFIAVNLAFWNTKMNLRERLFLTLNVSQGVATATIAFILFATLTDPNIRLVPETVSYLTTILNLSFLFILYSIILSSIAVRLSWLFGIDNSKSILAPQKEQENKGK